MDKKVRKQSQDVMDKESYTPGQQVDHYSDATSEAVKQEVKSLNNIGAPTSVSPDPFKK